MEQDLFAPIKDYFEKQGYHGDGEVGGIDLYLQKDGISVAVELKINLDFKVIQQAALRQKIADTVFIAIYRPAGLYSRTFQNKIYLLKRLGIGLLVVGKRLQEVELITPPIVTELSSFQKRSHKKKEAIAGEFQKRKLKVNAGGVSKKKLITGYREDALMVLDALFLLGGTAKTSQIRKLSGIEKTQQILYNDYYDWFRGISRGIYEMTDTGRAAMLEFKDIIEQLRTIRNNQ